MDKHALWQLASTGHQRSGWASGRDLDFTSCLRTAGSSTGTTAVSEWLQTFLAIGSRIAPIQLSITPPIIPGWLLSPNQTPEDALVMTVTLSSLQQQQQQQKTSNISTQPSESFSTGSLAPTSPTLSSGAGCYTPAASDVRGIGHTTAATPLRSRLEAWSSTATSGLLQQQQEQQQQPNKAPSFQQDPGALLISSTSGAIPAWKLDAMVDNGSLLSPDSLLTRRVFSTTSTAAGLTHRVDSVFSLEQVQHLVASHPALTTSHLAKLTYKAAELLNSQSHPGMSTPFAASLVRSMMQDIQTRLEQKISRLGAQDLRLILHGWSQANYNASPETLSAIVSGLLPGHGARIAMASSDDLLVIIRALHKLQAAPLNLLHATAMLMARRAPNENFTKVAEFAHLLSTVSPSTASLSAASRALSGGGRRVHEVIPVRSARNATRKALHGSGSSSGSSYASYQELTGPQRSSSISSYSSNTMSGNSGSSSDTSQVYPSLAGLENSFDLERSGDSLQTGSSHEHWLQSTPGLSTIAQSLVNAALPKLFSAANTQDIIKLVAAFSNIGFYSFQLCDASAAALLPQLHTATLRQVAALSHAFALSGHSHAMLFESLALHATPQLAASVAEVEAERRQGMLGLPRLPRTIASTTTTAAATAAPVAETAVVSEAAPEGKLWTSWNPWGVVSKAVIGSATEADKAATRASHRAATIRDITQIAAAFTSLGYFHPPLFDAVATSAAQRLELQGKVRVFPSDLCKLAATYTGAGHYDGRLYRALSTKMAAMSGSLTLPELIHLLTCFALARHYDIGSVRLLVDRATAELQAAAAFVMPQHTTTALPLQDHQSALQKAGWMRDSMQQQQLSHTRMPFQDQQRSGPSSSTYQPHKSREQYIPPLPLSTFWLPGVVSLSSADNRPANPAEYESMLQPLPAAPLTPISPYNSHNQQEHRALENDAPDVDDCSRLPLAMQSATRALAICATFAHPCQELLQLLSDVSVVIKDASLSQEAQPSWTAAAPPPAADPRHRDRRTSHTASTAAAAAVVPLYMVESEELSLLTVSELCRLVGDLALLEGLPSQQGGGGQSGGAHNNNQLMPATGGDTAGGYGTQLQQSALGTLSARLYPRFSISRPSVDTLVSNTRHEGGPNTRTHTTAHRNNTQQQSAHHRSSHSFEQQQEEFREQQQPSPSSRYSERDDSGQNAVSRNKESTGRLTGADRLCLYSAYVKAAGRQRGEAFLASLGPGGGSLIRESASAWRTSPMCMPPSAAMVLSSVEDALRQRGRRVRLNTMTADNLLHVPLMVEDSRGGWVVVDVGDSEQGMTRGGEAVRGGAERPHETHTPGTHRPSPAGQHTRDENRASSVLWKRGVPSHSSNQTEGPDGESVGDERVVSSRVRLARGVTASSSVRDGGSSKEEDQQLRLQPSMQLGDGAFRAGCLQDRGLPSLWVPFQQWRVVEATGGIQGVGAWVEALLLQCEAQRVYGGQQGGGSVSQGVQGRPFSGERGGQDGRGRSR